VSRRSVPVSGERFAKPRIFINGETAVGTLCFPNDGRSFGKYCTTRGARWSVVAVPPLPLSLSFLSLSLSLSLSLFLFLFFLRGNCGRYVNAVDFNWSLYRLLRLRLPSCVRQIVCRIH
jgi:hypothetical protein